MKDDNNLIEIDNLKTVFFTDNGTVMSVNGVSFDIPKNKIIGVVGESGCGKSVTSLSIMQLVQAPQGQVRRVDAAVFGDRARGAALTCRGRAEAGGRLRFLCGSGRCQRPQNAAGGTHLP